MTNIARPLLPGYAPEKIRQYFRRHVAALQEARRQAGDNYHHLIDRAVQLTWCAALPGFSDEQRGSFLRQAARLVFEAVDLLLTSSPDAELAHLFGRRHLFDLECLVVEAEATALLRGQDHVDEATVLAVAQARPPLRVARLWPGGRRTAEEAGRMTSGARSPIRVCRGELGEHATTAARCRRFRVPIEGYDDVLFTLVEASRGMWCLNADQPVASPNEPPLHFGVAVVTLHGGHTADDPAILQMPALYVAYDPRLRRHRDVLHNVTGQPARVVLRLYEAMRELFAAEGGRPRGSGTFQNAAEFRRIMVAAAQELHAAGRPVTQENLATYLTRSADSNHPACDAKQINRWCRNFRVRWSDIKRAVAE